VIRSPFDIEEGDIKIDESSDILYNTIDMLSTNNVDGYTVDTLISVIRLCDYLGIDTLCEKLIDKIISDIILLDELHMPLFFGIQSFTSEEREMVNLKHPWLDGKSFCV
jgi:hypothetical protein